MNIDFYIETRKNFDFGLTKKVYTGNLLQRIFRIGPYREETIFGLKGIYTRSPGLEIFVQVYTKNLEWIDTLYYGNKKLDNSNVNLLYYKSEESYRVKIDREYLSSSYRYFVFVAHYKKKDIEREARLVMIPAGKDQLDYRDFTKNEWQVVGFLDMSRENFTKCEIVQSDGTLLDLSEGITKQLAKYDETNF